jgi:uncharacterized membrane protein YbaN (DUF454 family)
MNHMSLPKKYKTVALNLFQISNSVKLYLVESVWGNTMLSASNVQSFIQLFEEEKKVVV